MPPPRTAFGKRDLKGFTLAEVFVPQSVGQQTNAFTLAEVLITLGIIGVIAAMTLPSLIANKEKKELHTALLKNYSVLQQALLQMSKDFGEQVTPYTHNHMDFADNFKNYLNFIKYCSNQGCIGRETNPDDNSNQNFIKNYKTYNKSKNVSTVYFDDGQIVLNDGSFIMIEHPGYWPLYITIDVNGYNKKPNVWGHDLFTFQLMADGKLLPMGMEGTQLTNINTFCSKNSNDNLNGISCTEKAINDKDYWKNLP